MEQWYLHCKKADFADISRKFNISPMLARIIRNRDVVGDENIYRYLNASVDNMYDPLLLKGMPEGVQLMSDAIKQKKHIRVIGDYDVDGVCSSYILKTYIESVGGIVDVRIPDRIMEGYGMNSSMVNEAKEDGVTLIITCDNGISSVEAIALAREYGIDVIVTDHHEPPTELPCANVIIDPKQEDCTYPFREICGGGVAYKFVQALDAYLGVNNKALLDDLLQFAGIATIADIVPLLDENRIFAAEGIRRLKNTQNIGINSLLKSRGLDKESINANNIGFVIGPCINSAGRLKNATIAFNLLEEKNPSSADLIAEELSSLNEQRKNLTVTQTAVALNQLRAEKEAGLLEKIIIIYLPEAHESVAGIIAGRLKDEFNRPTIVVTRSEDGLKGSGRSTDHYNMIENLRCHEELFIKCGGHAKACGFSLRSNGSEEETVKAFSESMNADCCLKDEEMIKNIWIDMQLPFKYITESFVNELGLLEPFGMMNEKPVFAQKNVTVVSASIVGKNNNVLKMLLEDAEGTRTDGIMFGDEDKINSYFDAVLKADKISILFYPDINRYMGRKNPQAIIQSISF